MVIKFDEEEFDVKRVLQAVAASVAMALAIFLVTWVLNYFNATAKLPVLTNITDFLTTYWYIIVGFVLFITIWEYIYPLYSKKLNYVKPIADATSIMFGLWLVAVFLKGLLVIVSVGDQASLFLTLLYDLYFQQFAILYLLFVFVGYSRFFLSNRS